MPREIQYYDYEVKTPALLVSSSDFAKDLLKLIRKYDENFPEKVVHLSLVAEVGEISDWVVTAFKFIQV